MRSDRLEFNDASVHSVTLLGRQLWLPKLAAVLLCFYATGYSAFVLLVVFTASETLGASVYVLGALALATTPFIALIHLSRATTQDSSAPMRPLFMMIVMAAPTFGVT